MNKNQKIKTINGLDQNNMLKAYNLYLGIIAVIMTPSLTQLTFELTSIWLFLTFIPFLILPIIGACYVCLGRLIAFRNCDSIAKTLLYPFLIFFALFILSVLVKFGTASFKVCIDSCQEITSTDALMRIFLFVLIPFSITTISALINFFVYRKHLSLQQ